MAYLNNSFSRTRENESKLGAYYTDVAHCEDLRRLFIFPKDEEVCVLEPSIGDASAVISITGAAENPNIKIFGVELNDSVAKTVKENPLVAEVLRADFTSDVVIRKNSFSFCFANPPYMEEASDYGEKVRLERLFLEKIPNYLKVGGLLVWIIPEHSFLDNGHLRQWMRNFDTLCYYRFRKDEYAKYKQIAVIGRKVSKREVLAFQVQNLMNEIQSSIKELPSNLEPHIEVEASYESDIDLFTTRIFDFNAAYSFLQENGLPDDSLKVLNRMMSQPEFAAAELKRPAIPLKKDSLYLLATSGAGQGLTGSIATKDLHLQRGIAEVIEETTANDTEEEATSTLTVTTRTAISMHIVQNNGTITTLA